MIEPKQMELALIPHKVETSLIEQRIVDGYINATELCKASGKLLGNYLQTTATKSFLDELSSDIGIPISDLVQVIKGGIPRLQGTWVHPQVAINLGQWASPKFAVAVSKWVFDWMRGEAPNKKTLPYHIQRYLINRSEIPPTHFSIFNEIMFSLIAPLEDQGYQLPDKMIPDISQGLIFCKWLREIKKLDPKDFPTYTHTYPDGRKIPDVKLYPNELLPEFRKHFHEVWMKEKAGKYFNDRDKNAIPFIDKILKTLPSAKKQAIDL